MNYHRFYTETTTGGTVREVYGKVGGGTGDFMLLNITSRYLLCRTEFRLTQ